MTTTPGPRTEAGKLEYDLLSQTLIVTERLGPDEWGAAEVVGRDVPSYIGQRIVEAEARADVDGLVARLREALALRPSGRVGPERIPWFTHTGISHGEGAECYVCALLAGDKADARRFFTHDEAGDVYTDLPLVAGDKAEAPE